VNVELGRMRKEAAMPPSEVPPEQMDGGEEN
jgi:hypothetical protein